jgi:hypothetical protein
MQSPCNGVSPTSESGVRGTTGACAKANPVHVHELFRDALSYLEGIDVLCCSIASLHLKVITGEYFGPSVEKILSVLNGTISPEVACNEYDARGG